jgi:hypothetical protein
VSRQRQEREIEQEQEQEQERDSSDKGNSDGNNSDSDDTNNKFDSDNSEDERFILSELPKRVKTNNARVAKQMVDKSIKKAHQFRDGEIATLFIPAKLRLATEAKRLPCRILKCTKALYSNLRVRAITWCISTF